MPGLPGPGPPEPPPQNQYLLGHPLTLFGGKKMLMM